MVCHGFRWSPSKLSPTTFSLVLVPHSLSLAYLKRTVCVIVCVYDHDDLSQNESLLANFFLLLLLLLLWCVCALVSLLPV